MGKATNMLTKTSAPFFKSLKNFGSAVTTAYKDGGKGLSKMKFRKPPKEVNAIGGGAWNKGSNMLKREKPLAPNNKQRQIVANSNSKTSGFKEAFNTLKSENKAAANTLQYGAPAAGGLFAGKMMFSGNDNGGQRYGY